MEITQSKNGLLLLIKRNNFKWQNHEGVFLKQERAYERWPSSLLDGKSGEEPFTVRTSTPFHATTTMYFQRHELMF